MFGIGEKTGAVADPDSASGNGGRESSVDLTSLREEVSEARKTRADKGTKRGRRSAAVATSEVTEAEIEELFKAENWEQLASLPFDTRYVMTGWEGFRLSDDERKRLAATTAMTMRILLKIDPKYIALTVWGTMYFGTWASKEAAYSGIKAKVAAQRKAAQPRVGEGSGHPAAV